MAKQFQVLKCFYNGVEYRVIHKYGDVNPYRIYHCYRARNQYGYMSDHKREVARYANMNSCFWWFAQNVN